jgi:hypothetical protein
MKRNLWVAYTVTVLLMVFTGCSDDDVVTPQDQVQRADDQADRASDAGRRKDTGKFVATPVTGTINGLAFAAEYRVTEFVNENNVLYAVGTLYNITGDGLPSNVADLSAQQIKMPVNRPDAATSDATSLAAPSCDILNLDLGPLDLDLLGLQVHLDEVVLTIVAQTGAGNLVGNLLCAITGLLDGVASLTAIAQLLNQLIGIIGILP